MFRFFKRKQEKKAADNFALLANMLKEEQAASISEPWTLAKARLEGGAKDAGAGKGLRMYNAHLSRLQNQWINPLQSVNSGYGTAHASLFLYQPVNYYECYSLAQDPLFAKVFNALSETPFAKGGELAGVAPEQKDTIEKQAAEFDVWQHLRAAVRSNYVTGGCLLYMDFGLAGEELTQPLDLRNMDMRRFRGFRHIDPINCVAVQVNTVNPAAGDYMEPSVWYVIGLGAVNRSHFLKFEANIPELPMRPLTLYFGMPLTQLIKQDVANSNLASQGLANLMNRFRFTYLKADESSFTTENAQCFKDRLNFMSFVQDNFGVCPIKTTEDVMQLTTSLAGMAENVEEFYLLISAKTDIPYTELMGKSAEGMNATGSGDRRKWYDKCRSIQESVKNNLLFMYGIVAGIDSGKFVKFTDFTFNPLEEATEKELAENIKSYAEVASALVNLGAKQDEVFEWLKQFKQFNLDGLSFDTETEGLDAYDDITDEVLSEFRSQNDKWITVKPNGDEHKGRHLLLEGDETPKQAMERQWGVNLDKKSVQKTLYEYKEANSVRDAQQMALNQKLASYVDYSGMSTDVANTLNRSLINAYNEFPAIQTQMKYIGIAQNINKKYKEIKEKEFRELIRSPLVEKKNQLYKQLQEAEDELKDNDLSDERKDFLEGEISRLQSVLRNYSDDALEAAVANYTQFYLKKLPKIRVSKNTIAVSLRKPREVGGISLNKEFAKNSDLNQEDFRKCVRLKFHPIGCDTYQSTFDHEIGHRLDLLLNITSGEGKTKSAEDLLSFIREEMGKGTDYVTNNLSAYGSHNEAEFLAEAYSEYKNNPEPRPIAKKVGFLIKKAYNEYKEKSYEHNL